MSSRTEPVVSRLSLEGTHPRDRAKVWSRFIREGYYRSDFESIGEGFDGHYEGVISDGFITANIACGEISVIRRKEHFCDSVDAYMILIPRCRSIMLRQRGRELVAPEESVAFYSTTEPYLYHQDAHTRSHSIVVPGAMLRSRKPDADDFVGSDLRTSRMHQVFADFAASLCRHAPSLDADGLRGAHGSLLDMLALVLEGADAGSSETVIQSAHRRRILKVLEGNFQDPNFSLDLVASRLGLSPRYIQQILASREESVSKLVRRRRIREACRMLDGRDLSRAAVSTIAHSVGYADPAYFSRVFRQSMGMSPVDYSARRTKTLSPGWG